MGEKQNECGNIPLVIFSQQRGKINKRVFVFVLLTGIVTGLSQQGVDCHRILIQMESHYRAPPRTVSNHQLCGISQQHQRRIHSPGNTQNEVLVQLVLFPNSFTWNT